MLQAFGQSEPQSRATIDYGNLEANQKRSSTAGGSMVNSTAKMKVSRRSSNQGSAVGGYFTQPATEVHSDDDSVTSAAIRNEI